MRYLTAKVEIPAWLGWLVILTAFADVLLEGDVFWVVAFVAAILIGFAWAGYDWWRERRSIS
jgi:hypothetical protein